MRSILIFLPAIILAIGFHPALAQDEEDADFDREEAFAEANRLYEEGDFARAHILYSKVAADSMSAKLFFNLGNAEFRVGRFGYACLWYRRAATLDPKMVEATTNLRFLKRKMGFLEFRYSGLGQFVSWLPGSQWKMILWGGVWLLLLGSAILIVLKPRQPWAGILLALTICGPLIAAFGGAATWIHKEERGIETLGVVTGLDVVALTGAFPDAEPVIELPPGTEVRIDETRGEWRFVYIPAEGNLTAGWVKAKDVEPLWPYERMP